jgi:hypothetical protein
MTNGLEKRQNGWNGFLAGTRHKNGHKSSH